MNQGTPLALQSDVCLLLRSHAEQRWLSREILPVLLQLETPGALPAGQVGAAMAYLEAVWVEARLRAWQTDATHDRLEGLCDDIRGLANPACRYYAAVRRLREALDARLTALLSSSLRATLYAPAWPAPGDGVG